MNDALDLPGATGVDDDFVFDLIAIHIHEGAVIDQQLDHVGLFQGGVEIR